MPIQYINYNKAKNYSVGSNMTVRVTFVDVVATAMTTSKKKCLRENAQCVTESGYIVQKNKK